MKLYIKQKFFSWRDRFTVKDANGNDRYYVEGEIFSWGKRLHVYRADGTEAAYIRQRMFTWLPRYYVEIDGREVCHVVKEFTFLRPRYRLDGIPWHMEGDFFGHDYALTDGRRQVMYLSKAWFTWGDSYELDIAEPGDELLCLCVALAVDCALAAQQAASNASTFPGT